MRQGALGFAVSVTLGGLILMAVQPTANKASSAISPPASPPSDWNLIHVCTYCHNPHGGPNTANLHNEDVEVLCLTCHGPGGIATPVEVHLNKQNSAYAPFRMTCLDCHDKHKHMDNWLAGINIKTVGPEDSVSGLARIQTPNSGLREVVYESRGSDAGGATLHSFADNDEDGNGYYDGVCETCHTQTNYHRNSIPDPGHHIGKTCVDCHGHADSFLPTGGSCVDCHASPQDNGDNIPPGGRRAMVGEFGLTSHHVTDGTVANVVTDADCVVCHEMTQHQAGYVRLLDVDTGALLVHLTGDPMTVPAEGAKLPPFCLACHDADGAAGLPPFSDGQTPPVVDDVLWTASSHAAQTTCFGNGTTGCHSSGHGSAKRNILGPFGTGATAPANAEEEEGFCFECHDSDGPALIDVASAYAAPIRWVSNVVGDNDNLNLNDRHDIQHAAQTVSGAKIECTDCHDPHAANSAAPLVPDPDPGDGRVPGTGQVLAGADFQSEWCLDCHDGDFPVTVTPPTTALNDVRTSSATDAMGMGGGNAVLKSGYGWTDDDFVPCASCHVTAAHTGAKTNLFHGVDLVKSKDGLTNVPSDNFGLDYQLTDNNIKQPQINGWEWCNTCHTNSMGDKKLNCFACHFHGTRW